VQPNILTPPYSPPSSETVHGAVDSFAATGRHVDLHQRRFHIPMPEEFLQRAGVSAIFPQGRGERVS
jgi:hypothetical protein